MKVNQFLENIRLYDDNDNLVILILNAKDYHEDPDFPNVKDLNQRDALFHCIISGNNLKNIFMHHADELLEYLNKDIYRILLCNFTANRCKLSTPNLYIADSSTILPGIVLYVNM